MTHQATRWIFGALLSLAPALGLTAERHYAITILHALPGRTDVTDVNAMGHAVGFGNTVFGNFGGTDVAAVLWQDFTPRVLGTVGTQAQGINDRGVIVGTSGNVVDGYQALVWQNGTQQVLPPLSGDAAAYASGINQAGQIAGWSGEALENGAARAVVWTNGTPAALGRLDGSAASWAFGLNDAGQVVGQSRLSGSRRHATLWNGSVPIDLGTLAGRESMALAVNAAGQVVGWSESTNSLFPPENPRHAVLWNGTEIIDLAVGSVGFSEASDINAAGQIVGTVNGRATLWEGHVPTDLNIYLSAADIADGWEFAFATAISEEGHIVGEAHNHRIQRSRTLLLSPVPELNTSTLLVLGIGLLSLARRRRSD